MPNPSRILTRALGDRFHNVANPISVGNHFFETLRSLVRAANKTFEAAPSWQSGSPWRFIMDIEEVSIRTPLRPEGDNSFVLTMNIYDTSKTPRAKTEKLTEPGLVLRYLKSGTVECSTHLTAMTEVYDAPGKTVRIREYSAYDIQALEAFVGTWLRKNLDARTVVAIADQADRLNEHDEDNFHYWSKEQLKRKDALNRD